jgi:hypothetical protein
MINRSNLSRKAALAAGLPAIADIGLKNTLFITNIYTRHCDTKKGKHHFHIYLATLEGKEQMALEGRVANFD